MDLAEKYGIDMGRVGKTACPNCRKKGGDSAGNNLAVYGIGKGCHCWACGWTIPSDEHREAMGWDEEEEQEEEVVTREAITDEENKQIKSYTTTKGQDWRGIRDETNAFFGVRYEIDEETGKPCKQYVPTTIDGKLVGYRTRVFPKDFTNPIGQVGKECDMIGEFRFKNHTRTCLLVGGETKLLTSYQMLLDNQIQRDKTQYETTAVVCSTLGESGAWKQVQTRYDFFNQFEKVIICMDSDTAGEEATEKIAKVLPKGKAYVMKMRHKDADDYVKAGQEREFIQDFWNSKPYTPAGILSSADMMQSVIARAQIKKTPLPPFMTRLQKMMAGGIPLGYIVNIGAASGIGKSSYINELVWYWVFNAPFKIGVVSLEANAGEYGENLLSRHIGNKIALIENDEEKVAFLKSEEVQEKAKELWTRENGEPRFYLLEDNGDMGSIKDKVEQMVLSCGCQIIVLDPLNDAMAGMSLEQAEMFMAWQKSLVKSHNITIINCVHVRKSSGGQQANSRGAELSEEDFHGSSAIFKSGAANILMMRDKYNEDLHIRNTTRISVSKIRWTGVTGSAGEAYYDNQTHTLWDKDEYMAAHPGVF